MATASRSDGISGSTPPQAAAPAQQPAADSHDSLAVARQDLDVLLGDLAGVCGQLEELATTWRREHASGTSRPPPLTFPHRLQDSARQLAAMLRALAEAGTEPDLAASAVASSPHCGTMSLPPSVTPPDTTAAVRRDMTPARHS